MKETLKKTIKLIPFIGKMYEENRIYKTFYPPGHYANPFPSIEEVNKYALKIFDTSVDGIKGINLNTENQLTLLNKLCLEYNEIPYKSNKIKGWRYYFENQMFSYSDGIFLWSMINSFCPSKIIEVGSGFSSAIMLDLNNQRFNNKINLTFIEPYTDRLKSLLNPEDNQFCSIIEKPVQDIPLDVFQKLEENDILFLDTSHIFKTGSDLNYDFFEILPSLKKGVIIHIHDIFFPFEYPKEWILQQKAYNEIYILKSFLMFNDSFEIILFPNYLITKNKEWFEEKMPNCLKNTGGSIWLRKVK